MIDLKQVAEMAQQDADVREYVSRVFRDSPDSGLRKLAEDSIALAESLTEDLAKHAMPQDTTH